MVGFLLRVLRRLFLLGRLLVLGRRDVDEDLMKDFRIVFVFDQADNFSDAFDCQS